MKILDFILKTVDFYINNNELSDEEKALSLKAKRFIIDRKNSSWIL